jgi:DNA-binding protein YbaB
MAKMKDKFEVTVVQVNKIVVEGEGITILTTLIRCANSDQKEASNDKKQKLLMFKNAFRGLRIWFRQKST